MGMPGMDVILPFAFFVDVLHDIHMYHVSEHTR